MGTLGRGGVGEVYRAWDGRLEREVALKLLHDDYPQQGNRERFLIEARAASALNHANICTIFDIGQKDGWPYLVLELLKGITLKQRIERSSMSAEEIIRVGSQIAEALGAAHALGIIHRDIKPANVMLTRQADGRTRVKVLDFGLAKLTGPLPGQLNHREEHLTVVGEAVGTVSYMSPEQARGEMLDHRSDLFSLGTVMYEMATRRTPFQGTTTAMLFAQLLGRDPEPIREWNDSIPRPLEKVILRLLEKDPDRRFREASDVVEALDQVSIKLAGSRWRRGSSPAVPLVRVDEPVARPELPVKPDFLRDQLKPVRGSSTGIERAEEPEDLPVVQMAKAATRRSAGAVIRSESWTAKRGAAQQEPVPESPDRALPESSHGSANRHVPEAACAQEESATAEVSTPEGGETRCESSGDIKRAVPEATAEVREEEQPLARAQHSWPTGGILHVADPADYDSYVQEEARARAWHRRMWLLGGVAAAVLCTAGALFTVRAAGNHGGTLGQSEGLMVTAVENHTGVQSLDGSIAQGVEFELAQTEGLTVRGVKEFLTTVHALDADGQPVSSVLARQAAEAAGARAYVYGEIREGEQGPHGTGAGFVLRVAVLESASGRELASAEAPAENIQGIAGAIDQVSQELAQRLLGGAAGSLSNSDAGRKLVPLAREASGNLNALHAYAVGVEAEAEGRRTAALRSFVLAGSTDPGFVQTQLAAAWLGRQGGAEVASTQAALRGMDASQDRSARTVLLAEVAGDLIGKGDTDGALTAARTLMRQNSHDPAAELALVRALRAAGQYQQAARSAEQAEAAGSREDDVYREGALSLLALDRYDAALEMEERSAKQVVEHPEIQLEAAFLAGKQDRVTMALAEIGRDTTDPAIVQGARAAYLDNIGELPGGQAAWSEAARAARVQPGMTGAAELMLAKAALNRAFTGECAAASQLARVAASRAVAGREAHRDAALAAALCNDSEVSGNPAGDIRVRAADSLSGGEPEAAALALGSAGDGGVDPVRVFLRGMAHLQAGNAGAAVRDFQDILQHRGATYATRTNLYPAAQLKLARAYTESGDRSRSMEAYRQFLRVWTGAASGDRLRTEASAGVRGELPVAEPERPRVLVAATPRQAPVRRKEPSSFPTPAWLLPSQPAEASAPERGVGEDRKGLHRAPVPEIE